MFASKKKIFCVGRNKTGTTSLEAAFVELGYRVGNWAKAELLIAEWERRDFKKIISFCRTAQAFRDVPFSLPYTYQAVDMAYPGSKFILTVRDSSEQWYESVVRFHTKIIGNKRRPTPDDLKEFSYRYKGYLWRLQKSVYGADERTLYNRDLYIRQYEEHNEAVRNYFRFRSDDLLELNLGQPDAMQQLCRFLGVKFTGQTMGHHNRSGD